MKYFVSKENLEPQQHYEQQITVVELSDWLHTTNFPSLKASQDSSGVFPIGKLGHSQLLQHDLDHLQHSFYGKI